VHIGITGASGLIGRHIVDIALRRGHEIIAFSRSPQRSIPGCTLRAFAPPAPPDISGCDALIHLAGESVLGLWTPAKKRRITGSRIEGTRAVAQAIAQARTPPEVLAALRDAFRKAAATKAISETLVNFSMEPMDLTGDALVAHNRREIDFWGKLVRAQGIKPN